MENKNLHKNKQGGYALIIAIMFFMAGSTVVVSSISDAVTREVKTVRNESLSKQSYFTSESALEDALYRIKNSKTIGSTETLVIGNSTSTVSIADQVDGSKEIVSSAVSNNAERNTTAYVNEGSTVGFDYAVQTGLGGIDIYSSTITGDLFTSGSIRGCSGCTINGNAVAAATGTISMDSNNSVPIPPTQSINFGTSLTTQDIAQSFTISSTSPLMNLKLYIKKVGNPSNATIKITPHSNSGGGRPNFWSPLASGTLSSSLVSTDYEWIEITLTANPILTQGTTYWIVIDANANATNYYTIAANSSYGGGQAKIGRGDTTTWNNTTPSGLDFYFQTFLGSNKVGIAGQDEYNRMNVVSAYANQVSFVNASGVIYCQAGGSNNKPCDESRADPEVQEDPIPASTIDFWKSEAEAGGATSSISVDWAGMTLGPKKVNGNLTVSGGGTLNVSGTLWVTGNVIINGGSTIRPSNNTKSYTIVADGTITLSGGADIQGNSGSHILLLSTNTGNPAISINGGANDTALAAPYGTASISGGANVKAMAAKHIIISGGATIHYDPEMSFLNLSGGTATTSFNIKSWKETE